MKTAEILRKLADMIDSHSAEQGGEEVERPVNTAAHIDLEPVEVDNTEGGEVSTMVPPLQQKLEILKKSAGIDSHYDEYDSEGNPVETPCDSAEDAELALMKQRAGISPAVIVASDDNDITG